MVELIDQAELLKAGAYLPSHAVIADGASVDVIDARLYRHRALGARTIIRLTPSMLASGEDGAMNFFGFDEPEVHQRVAQRQRQALGFPSWVLVHDPDNGPRALEISKAIGRQAKRAQSSPKLAKEAFDAIGDELARELPHFLPSFYEQVGRVFLEANSPSFAATAFSKAREAEQVYALTVDEAQRSEAFIEFALAGALTNKVMTTHAADLVKRHGAASAYAVFFELSVRRTLGGTPPHNELVIQLRRLAKGAGLNAIGEDVRFIEQIWPASSLSRAPQKFFESYKKALASLAKDSVAVRQRLLNLFPDALEDEAARDWLELLEQCGALEGLHNLAQGDHAQPEGSLAAWFGRMCSFVRENERQPDAMFVLLRAIAPRLREQAEPLSLCSDSAYSYVDVDIELADLALELGLALDDSRDFALGAWAYARSLGDSSERGRDLLFVGQDPRFKGRLDDSISAVFGDAQFQSFAALCPGLKDARRNWLNARLDALQGCAVPGLATPLEELGEETTAKVWAEFPEAFTRAALFDPVDAIVISLRTGLVEEFSWPAYEQAWASFEKPNEESSVEVSGSFPYLILNDTIRAVVIGPTGPVLEHEFQLPKLREVNWLAYAGGQLFACMEDKNWETVNYWSATPKTTIDAYTYYLSLPSISVELADGGICYGARAVYPGDNEFKYNRHLYCDAQNFWVADDEYDVTSLLELDARSGKCGRASLPAFFEAFVADGKALELGVCELYPVASLESSPLGVVDGLYGLRVRSDKDSGVFEVEGIDGRVFVGPIGGNDHPDALVAMPGAELLRPVTDHRSPSIWSPTDNVAGDDGGLVKSAMRRLDLAFWHYFVPRSPRDSVLLRKVDPAQIAALVLTELKARLAKEKNPASWPSMEAALVRLSTRGSDACGPLDLQNTLLGSAVAQTIACAVDSYWEFLARLDGRLASSAATGEVADGELIDEQVHSAISLHFNDRYGWHWNSDDVSLSRELQKIAHFFFQGELATSLAYTSTDWPHVFGRESVLLWHLTKSDLSPHEVTTMRAFLQLWAELGFLDYPGRMRLVEYCATGQPPEGWPEDEDQVVWCFEQAGNRYVAVRGDKDEDDRTWDFQVLEYAPDAAFKALGGHALKGEELLALPSLTAGNLTDFTAALEANGPLGFDAAGAHYLAEQTGLSYGEAALVMAGLPKMSSWEKNFLPTELRTQMGLKVNEATAARDSLNSLDSQKLAAFQARALPADPAILWRAHDSENPGLGHAGFLAQAWKTAIGRVAVVPADLLNELTSTLELYQNTKQILGALLDPQGSVFAQPAQSVVKYDYTFEVATTLADGRSVDLAEHVSDALSVIGHLFVMQPVGDSVRQAALVLAPLLRQSLEAPELIFELSSIESWNKKAKLWKQLTTGWLEGVGGEPIEGGVDNGFLIARVDDDEASLFFRPARRLSGADHPLYELTHRSEPSPGSLVCEQILAPGFAALLERIATTPVPEGQYEANALHACPELTAEVQKTLDVGSDGAVLFLQTLALYNPTTANVRTWNGWTAARYKKAGAELVAKGLLIEAKRARAGRTLFVDGGWQDFKKPHLPLETWKLTLYGIAADARPARAIVVGEPLHTLFAKAWARWAAGERPGF